MKTFSKKTFLFVLTALMLICLTFGMAGLFVRVSASGSVTMNGNDIDFSENSPLTMIAGRTDMGGGLTGFSTSTAYRPCNYNDDATSEDGKVLEFPLPNWTFNRFKVAEFKTPITVSGNDNCLTFRLKAHFSSGATYGLFSNGTLAHENMGIWIYALTETGRANEGVILPFDIEQDEWIDFTITDQDFERFVANDNTIKGFQIAGAVVGGGDESIFYDSGANLKIDSISVGHVDGGNEIVTGYNTLLTANDDYYKLLSRGMATLSPDVVNGANESMYKSKWGNSLGTSKPGIENIKNMNVASEGAYFDFSAMKNGATDGSALALRIDDAGLTTFPSVMFSNRVKASDIDMLTFRIYANLNSTGTNYCGWNGERFANDPGEDSGKVYNGIYFYGANETTFANGTGVLLDPTITQRSWTEFSVKGSDLLKLADADGYIYGFRIGSAFMSGSAEQLYNGDWNANVSGQNYDKCASLFIDSVTAIKPFTFDNDDSITMFTGNGDYTTTNTISKVEGMNAGTLNETWNLGWSNQYKTYYDLYNLDSSYNTTIDMADIKSNSQDGHALVTNFNSWGYTFLEGVKFSAPVKASDVEAFSMRMFINIGENTPYSNYGMHEAGKFGNSDGFNQSYGLYLYPLDSEGNAGTGILVNPYLTQRKWVDFIVCGETVSKLADADGYIKGFRIGAGFENLIFENTNCVMIDNFVVYDTHVATDWIVDLAPTCTANGSKHKECVNCGTTMETEVIPMGHSFGEWVEEVPATCTVSGTHGYKQCSRCEKYFDENDDEISDLTIAPHHVFDTWVEEVPAKVGKTGVVAHKDCVVCGKHFDADGNEIDNITINAREGVKYVSISLAGDIAINYYVYMFDMTNDVATITFKDEEYEVEGRMDQKTGCLKFTFGVAPKDYKEDVTIEIDEIFSKSYSIERYAQNLSDDSPAKELVDAMIDYCESARIYFYDGDAQETDDLEDDLSEYAASMVGEDANIVINGCTLVLESVSTINVYFTAQSITGIVFKVDEQTVYPSVYDAGNNQYVISVNNIVASDLDRTFVIKVGGYTLNYSALSYVYTTISDGSSGDALLNLVKLLYNYSSKANAYFEN